MRDEPILSSYRKQQQNHSLANLSENVNVKEQRGGSFLKAAGLISSLTLLSRIMGLVREQVFAALLGAGLHADAFLIGFRIPNLLRDLFAEGALSAAFIPTYARVAAERGREEAWRLGNRVLTLLAVILSIVVVAGIIGAWPLVAALAQGFDKVPGKAEVTVRLTRVMLPFLPLVSFAAVAMGMLNAEERYAAPALAPAMFNVVTILWGLGLWALGLPPESVALGWAIGTLLGGAAQFLTQLPPLYREGWRFRPEWRPRDPGIRQIAALMGPATVGLAAVQVNILVNSKFASVEPGAVAWLNYAFRILYLPIGLFGAAVGTIATTGLAKRAASGNMEGLRQTLRRSLSMLAFLTLPATAGLIVLREPIVRLLYQHGRFTPRDTHETGTAVLYYAIGLVAYAGVKVLAPAFYALGTPRVPLLGSVAAVATNLVLNLTLYPVLGFRSVALGTSLGSVVNIVILAALFERRVGGLVSRPFLWGVARMIVASGVMAAVVLLLARALEARVGASGLLAHAVVALGPVMLGGLLYLVAARAARVPEIDELIDMLRRRRRASAPPALQK
jgi:putative peptidoglycan lipid II flippase